MSTTSGTSQFGTPSINPVLEDKYSSLVSSTDPIAKQIVDNYTSIYNSTVVLNTSTDVNKLDAAAINIDNSFNNILMLATPCSSVSNTNKCSTSVCNYVNYIEQLYLDFLILIQGILSGEDIIKHNYDFLPFLMTMRISNMIINNPNNQNLFASGVQYQLCSGNTYKPIGLSPSVSAEYQALLAKYKNQEVTVGTRAQTTITNNFLLYILLPSIILIILLLFYIQYRKKAELNELAMKAAFEASKLAKQH